MTIADEDGFQHSNDTNFDAAPSAYNGNKFG